MRTIFILLSLSIFGCTSKVESTPKKPLELQGNWVLFTEIYEGETMDYSENPVKHVLTLGETGNFVIYSDLARFGLGEDLEKIITHGVGDYSVEENILQLTYSEDELIELFDIKSVTDKKLVLINQETSKESHYSKKDDRNKSR